MWWILAAICACLATLYIYLNNKNKYWINKGIKQSSSPVLLFGDRLTAVTRNESLPDMIQRLYNIGPNDRYCGSYDFLSPALVLKDPELIKEITVKDFDHWVDHRRVIPEGSDPIWDQNLFFLTGQRWRDMRSAVSPVFTGSKLKHMFLLMTKSAEQFVQHFTKKEEKLVSIEVKDTFARFTNDIIASTVFCFETDSLEDPNSEFFEMAKRITDFGGFLQAIKMFGYFIFPKIYKVLKVQLLSTEVAGFFYNIVKENIKSRREKNIVRPDMISLLMEARDNHKLIHGVQITDEDVTAQALVFIFAGLDTLSSLMSFMSYELSVNPDIQQKLIQEIDKTAETIDGELTYDTIKNMEYMDMVVSETLRKWPITPFVSRICTIPYTIEAKRPNEQPIDFKKGDIVLLPIYALHRDPKYFPNPERFDPERFSEENKSKITPYAYIPFGAGPRKCIGYRFALLEIKVLFFHLLSKFEVVPINKTQIPVKLSKKSLNMVPDGGLWVGLKQRQLSN